MKSYGLTVLCKLGLGIRSPIIFTSYYYGANFGFGNQDFKTFGWGIRLSGLVNWLATANVLGPKGGIASFILYHLDVEFDRSIEKGLPGVSPLGWTIRGGPEESITVVLL